MTFEEWWESTPCDDYTGQDRNLAQEAWNAALSEAAKIADSETELEGEPPKEMLVEFTADPILTMRALVQITKENISERIRILKEEKQP